MTHGDPTGRPPRRRGPQDRPRRPCSRSSTSSTQPKQEQAVLRLVRPDDAARAAHPARAAAGQVRDKTAVAPRRPLLGHVRVVRRDVRPAARPSRPARGWPTTRSSSTSPTTAGSRTRTPGRYAPSRSGRPTTAACARRSWCAGPATSKPAATTTTLASTIDLAPTILAACGFEPPPGLPGINLLDARRRGRTQGHLRRDHSRTTPSTSTTRRRTCEYRWVIEGPGS